MGEVYRARDTTREPVKEALWVALLPGPGRRLSYMEALRPRSAAELFLEDGRAIICLRLGTTRCELGRTSAGLHASGDYLYRMGLAAVFGMILISGDAARVLSRCCGPISTPSDFILLRARNSRYLHPYLNLFGRVLARMESGNRHRAAQMADSSISAALAGCVPGYGRGVALLTHSLSWPAIPVSFSSAGLVFPIAVEVARTRDY